MASGAPDLAATAPAPVTTKKKRNPKPLPLALACLTVKDKGLFSTAMECDPNPKSLSHGQEFLVAQAVTVASGEVFLLDKLSIDQTRALARNVGASAVGSLSKYQCRKAIALHFGVITHLESKGLAPTSESSITTSTICGAVNVVFSHEFLPDLLKVNDRKDRTDHESNNTHKDFWIRATDAHNSVPDPKEDLDLDGLLESDDISVMSATDEFTELVIPQGDVYLSDLQNNSDIDLSVVHNYTSASFRKKITTLFAIRRQMKTNMGKSGTHDNEPWNFVEGAMKKHTGFTKAAVYYFYMRCESVPDVDAVFQPFLDATIKGSSVDINDDHGSCPSTAKKRKKNEDAIDALLEQSSTMLQMMQESRQTQAKLAAAAANQQNLNQRIEIAKALGDTDTLRSLMGELTANQNNQST